jgi:hypothetical protein
MVAHPKLLRSLAKDPEAFAFLYPEAFAFLYPEAFAFL